MSQLLQAGLPSTTQKSVDDEDVLGDNNEADDKVDQNDFAEDDTHAPLILDDLASLCMPPQ